MSILWESFKENIHHVSIKVWSFYCPQHAIFGKSVPTFPRMPFNYPPENMSGLVAFSSFRSRRRK